MTGRDLILYILENGLEDKPVFEEGQFLGFMTQERAACKFRVGYGTITAWIATGQLDAFVFGGKYYIPANAQPHAKLPLA